MYLPLAVKRSSAIARSAYNEFPFLTPQLPRSNLFQVRILKTLDARKKLQRLERNASFLRARYLGRISINLAENL